VLINITLHDAVEAAVRQVSTACGRCACDCRCLASSIPVLLLLLLQQQACFAVAAVVTRLLLLTLLACKHI
jgi:hypothetical protein